MEFTMGRKVDMFMVIQMAVLVAALVMILSPAGSAARQAPAPAPTGKSLIECEEKIGSCGEQVFKCVFQNWTGISVHCCHQLVIMGKTCHDALVNDYTSHSFFKGNKAQVLEASDRTWNNCVSLPPAAAPPV